MNRILILFTIFERGKSYLDDQPRIETINGDLKFTTGTSKNIIFETLSGTILLNGDDISETIASFSMQIDQHADALDQLNKNYCTDRPCKNGGQCLNGKDAFYCQCPAGWTGQACAEDYNECSDTSLVICQNGGICQNRSPPQRFECECSAEYYGLHCSSKYNDCKNDKTCGEHGFCVDEQRTSPNLPAYTCRCDPGYESSTNGDDNDSGECHDTNECLNNPCYSGVKCVNTAGSYYCHACPPGMAGNGEHCEDINECAVNNGGCSQNPKVQCTNKNPGFDCGSCPSGYEGDGRFCRKASLCDVQNGGCSVFALCSATESGVTCKCMEGYAGNGIGPDGCKPNGPTPTDCNLDCGNGVCIVQNASPVCLCYQGFYGDRCENTDDPCKSSENPCKNGGTCSTTNNNADFVCQCISPWSGKTCEEAGSECQAHFTDETGSINYPSLNDTLYPANAKCSWTITVMPGKVLSFDFSKFDLESKHGSRCSDYVEFYNGISAHSNIDLIGTYCGTEIPHVPDSSQNQVEIIFHSDGHNEATGFKLAWTSDTEICGGVLTDENGAIRSPSFPNPYPQNSNCVWIIDAPSTKVVHIQFNSVDIYSSGPQCGYDYVRIFDGLAPDSDQIGSDICGHSAPLPMTTNGPFARIEFVSNKAQESSKGFDLSYTAVNNFAECGADLTLDYGEITSPGYPLPYTKEGECVWKIRVNDGDHIQFQLLDVDFEDAYQINCGYNFVQVMSGVNINGEWQTQRYCGFHKDDIMSADCEPENLPVDSFCRPLPDPIYSVGNEMVIEFRSDGKGYSGKGFSATYELGCGGVYNTPTQFASPDYPNAYGKDRECMYILHTGPENLIRLQFDEFALGDSESTNCSASSVTVYDGVNQVSPEDNWVLLKACENRIPEPVLSNTNGMMVKFVTDGNKDDHGFLAHFDLLLVHTGDSTCGGVYWGDGEISSPSYPLTVSTDIECVWYIRSSASYIVELVFTQFNFIPVNGNCISNVQLFDDGFINQVQNMGTFCDRDTLWPKFHSTQSSLTLYMFVSNDSKSGFQAVFAQLKTYCGGTIYAPKGTQTSPSYPSTYQPNEDCVWKITGPDNTKLSLSFIDFNLEYSSECEKDYLQIHNGHTPDSPVIGRYCGRTENGATPPPSIVSFSNTLFIVFHTDDMTEDTGFSFSWNSTVEGCGGEIRSTDGYLHSPNYPLAYPREADCVYVITTNAGSGLNIFVEDFHLDEADGVNGCQSDWLQLFEGSMVNGPPITPRLCGADGFNQMFQSNTSQATIWFHSDDDSDNDEVEGFNLYWTTRCDNHIRHLVEGTIQSHNYMNKYPPNQLCQWTIDLAPGLDIDVHFNDLSIQDCPHCECDNLTVSVGSDIIDTRCSTSNDDILVKGSTESGRQLTFIFRSDSEVEDHGFELQFRPTSDSLFQHFTENTGTLKTTNFDTGLKQNSIFYWQIEIDPNLLIKLEVSDSDIGKDQQTYVEVFNGRKHDPSKKITSWYQKKSNQKAQSTSNEMLVVMVANEPDWNRFQIRFSANWVGVVNTFACGAEFTSNQGQIQSPNYPAHYPNNAECTWRITIKNDNEDDHIVLSFETIDLEWTPGCWSDAVEIHDGHDSTASSLGRFCGTTLPEDIHASPKSDVFIVFETDDEITATGFSLTWGRNCGGNRLATEEVLSFSSPNYPEKYDKKSHCFWTINAADPSEKIFVHFTHFDTYSDTAGGSDGGNTDTCYKSDYVQIYETLRPNLDSPKYCGTTAPPLYISGGNTVRVLFDAEWGGQNVQRTGFFATFTTSNDVCGGEYWSESGSFLSPRYAEGTYSSNVNCIWTLSASAGNLIRLTFTDFDLEESSDCVKDYLQIRERDQNGLVLAKYCGQMSPKIEPISSQILWVNFVSDESVEAKGFFAVYEQIWGTTITGISKGQVASPLYPHYYVNNVDSEWFVYAGMSRTILYEVMDFDIICGDKLYLTDGEWGTGERLFDGCNDYLIQNPAKKIGETKSNLLDIRFRSDHIAWGHGFLLNFTAVKDHEIPPDPHPDPIEPGTCGNDFVVAGVDPLPIVSPGFPNYYQHNLDCFWNIYTTQGSSIEVNLFTMDIEKSVGCVTDYLAFIDGPTTGHAVLNTLCGVHNDIGVRGNGHELLLWFHSNNFITGQGFNGTYVQTCGGKMYERNGEISSPNYPDPYVGSIHCRYQIQLDQGYQIKVKFYTPLALDGSGKYCDENGGGYLKMINGNDNDGSPPLQPNIPPTPPVPGRLENNVSVFDMEGTNGYHCGRWTNSQQKPPIFESTVSLITIIFHSQNNDRKYEGFHLKWTTTGPTCGEDIVLTDDDNQGVIETAGYPKVLPESSYCVWTVTAPSGKAVQLDFEVVELVGTCDMNFVEIYDQAVLYDQPIATICGNPTELATIKTIGNVLTLKLFAGDPGSRFATQYSFTTCGGLQIGESGLVVNDVHRSGTDLTCETIIKGPQHYFLLLEFIDDFAVPCQKQGGEYVSGDYIEIIDFSKEGYFYLADPDTGNRLTVVADQKVYMNTPITDHDVYSQLWFWDYMYIRSVEYPDSVLVPNGKQSKPQSGDPLAVSRYVGGDLQKWIMIDGHLSPLEAQNLFLTISQRNELSLQSETNNNNAQIFQTIYSDVGKSLGLFCGTSLPKVITSLSNEVIVIHNNAKGSSWEKSIWSLNWTAIADVCGEDLHGDVGTIRSPNYPDPYDTSRRCEWTVTVNVNRLVELNFLDWDIRTSESCLDHYVQVFDGIYEFSPPLTGRLCSSTTPEPIKSHGNQMRIIFDTSVGASGERGFKASYSSDDKRTCGGDFDIISSNSDILIASPNYPNPFDANTECDYRFHGTVGHEQTYVFTWNDAFDLASGSKCEYDEVAGYIDGEYIGYHTSHKWYSFCGHTRPKMFAIPGPDAAIIFHSTHPEPQTMIGFKLNLELKQCGGVFGANEEMTGGTVNTPNYPLQYNENDYCMWLLVAPYEHTIAITFATFELNGPNTHRDCEVAHDWVRILNGPNMQAPILDTYCSTNKPELKTAFHTSGNEAIIIFNSDGSGQNNGFLLNWQADEGDCGNQMLNSETGTITSSGYPQNYPPLINCIWSIRTAQSTHIVLSFSDFDLPEPESNDICSDYLDIWDSSKISTGRMFDRYCGRTGPKTLKSSRNAMTLHMVSDAQEERKGFVCQWETVCGENPYMERYGTIQNSNYGVGQYSPNQNCIWNVSSSNPTDLVEFKFKALSLEPNPLCSNDYLSLYKNNEIKGDNLIGKYCGTELPTSDIKARGNILANFVTNGEIENEGWLIEFNIQPCGENIIGQSGTIANYHASDDDFDHSNLNCTWVIQSDKSDMVIYLEKWSQFDIEYSPLCEWDYVEIFDGADRNAPSLGRFCGKEPPLYVRSTGQFITIAYITDQFVSSAGFTVEWSRSLGPAQGCGGKIDVLNSGTIKSPINPATNTYYPELACHWELTAASSIKLEFKKFQLEPREPSTGKCFDFVEIIDGDHLSDKIIFGPNCGPLNPFFVKGSGSVLHIIFVTDEFFEEEGFEVTYSPYTSNCGGDLIATSEEQLIQWSYDGSNSNCQWNIKTDVGHYVHIQPRVIKMPESTEDYKLPITVHTRGGQYDYTVLLDQLYARKVTTVWLSIKGLDQDAHVGLCSTTDHDDVQWQMILGGWDGTKSCIHAEGVGSSCVVQRKHTYEEFQQWKNNIEIRITDRSFGAYDGDTGNEIVSYQSTAKYPILTSDFNYMLVTGYMVNTDVTWTVSEVAYKVEQEIKSTGPVKLTGQKNNNGTFEPTLGNWFPMEIVPSPGVLLTTIPRWFQQWSVEFEIKLTGPPKGEWTTVVHLTATGANNDGPSARVPMVHFHGSNNRPVVCSYVSGVKNKQFNIAKDWPTPEEDKWTKLIIKQEVVGGANTFSIIMGGQVQFSVENTTPLDLYNVEVWASDPWYPTPETLIRNLILQTSSKPDEQLLIGQEIIPRSAYLITTIPRYYKEYTVEVEIMLTERNRDDWTNLIGFTLHDGATLYPGDRMPVISLHPNKFRFQIAAYVNGDNNYAFNYPANDQTSIEQDAWTKIKVQQYYDYSEYPYKYTYSIYINDKLELNVENTTPAVFENIKVYVCGPGRCENPEAKIRNLKFKTISETNGEWQVPSGNDCWTECGNKGGKCSSCGTQGYCCSANKDDMNGDCTTDMQEAILNSLHANLTTHMCVLQYEEDSCSEFYTEKDIDYLGNDMTEVNNGDGLEVPGGVAECEDACRAFQPGCVGYSVQLPHAATTPNVCWLKSKLTGAREKIGTISGTLTYYDCRDNHNCGNSFVEFRDHNEGQHIGQEKHYCGHELPPDFFSYGHEAQVIIGLDSQLHDTVTPTFEASYKSELCNRVHSEYNGLIHSPRLGDNRYPPNADCTIKIQSKTQYKIQLYFDFFDLENSENCVNDYVKINNGAKVCGSDLPNPVFLTKNTADIIFHSNDYWEGFGFTISYVSNFDGCGGLLSSYTGNMYSTGYPGLYKEQLNCEWQIISPSPDQTITLEFNDINIFNNQENGACFEDERIEVYSGTENNPVAELVDILCGSSQSMPPISVSAKIGKHSHATVIFKTGQRSRTPSPPSGVWNGFWIHWST